jgi:pyruvate dehydrogenase E1 component alpha subunit
MPGVMVDVDFFAVYEARGEGIARAREGGGPTLIECKLNRYYGHSRATRRRIAASTRLRSCAKPKIALGLRWTGHGCGMLKQAEMDGLTKRPWRTSRTRYESQSGAQAFREGFADGRWHVVLN